MAERLTEKIFDNNGKQQDIYEWSSASSLECNRKLGELEDILEKYDIESVEELSKIFSYLSGRFINSVYSLKHKFDSYEDKIKYLANKKGQYYEELYETKQDRDTWKRACELACKWFKQTGFIGDQTKVDYFYQQAKKESKKKL